MARLWDTDMADRAAAIEQALKLGGRVIDQPKHTGFAAAERPEPPRPAYEPLPDD